MISHKTRTAIQSAAYERMVIAFDNAKDWDAVGISLSNVIEDTKKLIAAKSFDALTFLHELNRTRWKRLQNTQFVYWAIRNGHPRIEHSNGTHSYLQAHRAVYHIEVDSNVRDLMEHHERQLFHTLDEAVVYWRGWQVFEETNTESLIFACEYCTAYIWDGAVHEIMREPVGRDRMTEKIERLRSEQREAFANPHRLFSKQSEDGWKARELLEATQLKPEILIKKE